MTQIFKLWNIFVFVMVLLKGNVVKVDGQKDKDIDLEKLKNQGAVTPAGDSAAAANRFTTVATTAVKASKRTIPKRVSLEEDCDYLAYFCMKAYKTGKLCGRTIYYLYQNFNNYCAMDYVNCMERYEVWQVAHMGNCVKIKVYDTTHKPSAYPNVRFLDDIYVISEV